MSNTCTRYASKRFEKSLSLKSRPLRLLHNSLPDRKWVIRALKVNGQLFAVFWHRDTGIEVYKKINLHYKDFKYRAFNDFIRDILSNNVFSRDNNGYYRSGRWSKREYGNGTFVDDGALTSEEMQYAMKDDGHIYEGSDYPPAPLTPQWDRTDPCWRDDSDAFGLWGPIVRLHEDCR